MSLEHVIEKRGTQLSKVTRVKVTLGRVCVVSVRMCVSECVWGNVWMKISVHVCGCMYIHVYVHTCTCST